MQVAVGQCARAQLQRGPPVDVRRARCRSPSPRTRRRRRGPRAGRARPAGRRASRRHRRRPAAPRPRRRGCRPPGRSPPGSPRRARGPLAAQRMAAVATPRTCVAPRSRAIRSCAPTTATTSSIFSTGIARAGGEALADAREGALLMDLLETIPDAVGHQQARRVGADVDACGSHRAAQATEVRPLAGGAGASPTERGAARRARRVGRREDRRPQGERDGGGEYQRSRPGDPEGGARRRQRSDHATEDDAEAGGELGDGLVEAHDERHPFLLGALLDGGLGGGRLHAVAHPRDHRSRQRDRQRGRRRHHGEADRQGERTPGDQRPRRAPAPAGDDDAAGDGSPAPGRQQAP